MKKTVFHILLLCLFVNSFGQIKVNSDGEVAIGNLSTASYNLDVKGDTRFTKYEDEDGNHSIMIDLYNRDMNIYPGSGLDADLGKSSCYWDAAYLYNVNYYVLYQYSDINTKENINTIDSALIKIQKIRGVKFDYKESLFSDIDDKEKQTEKIAESKNKNGLIAQELLTVFPEVVKLDEETGLYKVNYIEMIPILVEAIKEQQEQIEDLQKIVSEHEDEIILLKKNK